MSLKFCCSCKEEKDISSFCKNKSTKDGLAYSCKVCNKEARHKSKIKTAERKKEYYKKNKEAMKLTRKTYLLRNKEVIKLKKRQWYLDNKDKEVYKSGRKDYRNENREQADIRRKKYYAENREDLAKKGKIYKDNNRGKCNAQNSKRRASKLSRTPAWLVGEDFNIIKNFYILAKCCEEYFGEPYHVDHIIPLQGELVSGLHVPENLQVITAKENLSKNNKWEI